MPPLPRKFSLTSTCGTPNRRRDGKHLLEGLASTRGCVADIRGGDHLATQKGFVESMTALRAKGLARTVEYRDVGDAVVRDSICIRSVIFPRTTRGAEDVTCV